ncbi:hypothetical protein ACFQX7_27715 [Luedemannella flava]
MRPRRPIYVTWEDLIATARNMDVVDVAHGRSNAWAKRLLDVTLQVRDGGHVFHDAMALTVDTMLHLVGMVSAGKSTLVMVLAVWAAGHGHTVTIVVGDNSAALRLSHDLSLYNWVRVAPVMGLNRARHTERLHRLQPPVPGRLLPAPGFGFELVSTACGLSALREAATPLGVREAPCQALVAHDHDDVVDGWRDKPKHTCPQWHGCQRHEASRRLVDANVWIATPWSLVHTAVPTPLGGTQIRYLEAAWRRSDLIIVDEADQVQANLDEMFANAQVLLGSSDEAWIDEIGTRVADKLRRGDRAQTSSKQVRRFTSAVNHARTAADLIYQLLQRDRSRAGRPVLNWIDQDYFTAWALFDQLALDWAGYTSTTGRRPADGWEDDPLYQALRASFNAFIDEPTAASHDDPVTADLARLAVAQLSDIEEDTRETLVRGWLDDLTRRELTPGRVISPSDTDHTIWRLEVALAVAVMAHRLNLMLTMWPQVAGELDMYDVITAELRKPPADLTAIVPESPMGNVLGFQYVEDDASSRDGQLGEFRFFRYSGVGRMLLVNLPDLFPADGSGPNVLLLSGTSWAGTSPRYHIDVPVGAILRPPEQDLAQIAKTTFTLDIQYTGPRRTPIWVSGRYGPQRRAALEQMVKELTKPGPGPGSPNRLDRERATLPPGRQKIMLLVGSYAEARQVTDALLKAKSSWQGQVRCLVGDDELETGWDDAHTIRRADVADFGSDDAWLLVTPILAIERGHNILNDEGWPRSAQRSSWSARTRGRKISVTSPSASTSTPRPRWVDALLTPANPSKRWRRLATSDAAPPSANGDACCTPWWPTASSTTTNAPGSPGPNSSRSGRSWAGSCGAVRLRRCTSATPRSPRRRPSAPTTASTTPVPAFCWACATCWNRTSPPTPPAPTGTWSKPSTTRSIEPCATWETAECPATITSPSRRCGWIHRSRCHASTINSASLACGRTRCAGSPKLLGVALLPASRSSHSTTRSPHSCLTAS